MNFSKLNTLEVIEVKNVNLMVELVEEEALADTYKTRIMSDGKQEATDTVTK